MCSVFDINMPLISLNQYISDKSVINMAEKPACCKCDLVFPDKRALDSHLLTCVVADKGTGPTSFSKAWIDTSRPNNGGAASETNKEDDNETEKILPLSQPFW